jgi:hypothetical protein
MEPPSDADFAKIAYDAFVKDTAPDYGEDEQALDWDRLPTRAKENWEKAALAVIMATCAYIQAKTPELIDLALWQREMKNK